MTTVFCGATPMIDSLANPHISLEQEIVLLSAKIDQGYDDRLEFLLRRNPDWSGINNFTIKNGVLPLLYSQLKTIGLNLIPEKELGQLKDLYLANAQRNLRLTRMLARITELFSKEGIQHIPIKGPTLAIQLYGDVTQRHFTDLDILIQEKDFHRCNDLLSQAGFIPGMRITKSQESWLLRGDTEFHFSYEGDNLETHWAIAERGVCAFIDIADYWHDLQPFEFLGKQVFLLSPESLFLMLCLHGTKHMWDKLAWISDLAFFTKAYPDFNWSKLMERAKKDGLLRIVCLGLNLAEIYGGARIPDHIRTIYRSDPVISELSNRALENICANSTPSSQSVYKYYIRARERTRDRLYYYIDQIFIPKQADWLQFPLPKYFYPAYFVLRPMRLLIKFGKLSNANR
jgi:hypothetical protein